MYFLPLLLAFSFLGAYEIIPDKTQVKILSPDLAQRKIGRIKLKNGLEAYLISDPSTEQSAAALTVNAGSWDEPEESQGIAHFLEHMLFLGTKKYPNESEFTNFLGTYAGDYNAFTYNDMTAYMFAIQNLAFEEALDRFASFFTEPLFNPSGVGREVKAIDQEFSMNAGKDDFLRLQVLQAIAKPDHPFSYFSIGNEESLKNVSQEVLKTWFQQHYSSDKMRLWVLSNQSLDSLVKLVEKDFEEIPQREVTTKENLNSIFSPEILGKLVSVEPLQDEMSLAFIWELPSEFNAWTDEKPWKTLCAVLGEEGGSSLLAQLKREELAEGLSCGDLKLAATKSLFIVEVALTDKGLQNKDKIVERVFQTIAMVKKKGISPQLFNEIHSMDKLNYQWMKGQRAFEEAMKNAFQQNYESLDTYPEKTKLAGNYSLEKLNLVLDQLTPEKAIYVLTAPSKKSGLVLNQKEPWTGVSYLVTDFDSSPFQKIQPIPEIDLPKTNLFIPTALNLKDESGLLKWKGVVAPDTLLNDEKGRLYFLQDKFYGTPQIYWSFQISTPFINEVIPQSVVFRDIMMLALQDVFSQEIFEAGVAGLNLSVDESEGGIMLTLFGYSDKASLLLEKLVLDLNLSRLTEERFNLIVSQLKRTYRNFQWESPLLQAREVFEEAVYSPYVTMRQKDTAIRTVTFDKFQKFMNKVWSKNYVEGLMLGNLTRKEALTSWKVLQKGLGSGLFPLDKQRDREVITLPTKKGPYIIKRKSKTPGSALVLGIEDPDFSMKKRAAQQVLQQSLSNDFFTELRTKQQTGYRVTSKAEDLERKLFDTFFIQSSTHSPEELLWRVETFIEIYLQSLTERVTEEQFLVGKNAIKSQLLEKPKSFKDYGTMLNDMLVRFDGDFSWMQKRVEALDSLTYEEFINLARETLGRDNRRRLAILLQGTPAAPFQYSLYKGKEQ